jgi:hypothetical protein
MKEKMQFTCCICGKTVETDDKKAYVLQVRQAGDDRPVALWSHGQCLREAIPVLGEPMP